MNLFKNVMTVGFITLLSRITGYIRDMFIAAHLGTGISGDIFIIILRLPNLFRSLFGEGALNTSFVPLYSKILANNGLDAAQRIASSVQTILCTTLLVFCVIFYIFMPEFIVVTTPHYAKDPSTMMQIIHLSRITICYLAFISLVAFYGGILNAHGKYIAFAVAPIIMNITLSICTMLCGITNLNILHILAYGVALSGALELLWMIIAAKKLKVAPSVKNATFSPEISVFFKRLLPGIMGSGVFQINTWIEMMIISSVPGGMSLLYYADRVNQLPLALIGTAFGTVLMPVLAKSYAQNDMQLAQQQQSSSIKICMMIAIPAAIALCLLAHPIISMLFEKGEFTATSSIRSAQALSVLACALPAYIVYKVFLSSLYASGDTKTPLKISIFSIFVNISVALTLVHPLQHVGMAYASVCAAWSNVALSYYVLHRRKAFILSKKLLVDILRIIFCGFIMGLALKLSKSYVNDLHPTLGLSLQTILGGILYAAMCLLCKVVTHEDKKLYWHK